jgi:molybdate transport system substrate-binding protein
VRRTGSLAALFGVATLAVTACGGNGDSGGSSKPRLVVSAASSMTEALTSCAEDYPGATVRLSFAGSDELAAQIRQGVRPDVYAAANTSLPEDLNKDGLLGKPVGFATNRLVIAVPKDSQIGSLHDVEQDGVKLAIGSATVPIGSYTRDTLARLHRDQEQAVLENVRSNEPDVKGIVGKLTQGAVDAGFVYITDVNAAGDQLRAVELPVPLEPSVKYAAGVVTGAKQPELARRFVDGLRDGACATALTKAGFGRVP